MKDVDLALADISSIRSHLAASTCFLGISPQFHTLTGGLVFFVTLYQMHDPASSNLGYILTWSAVMVVIGIFSALKAVKRASELHGPMALDMLRSMSVTVLPFVLAGTAFTWVIACYALDIAWLLPGFWQMLIGLLGFTIMSRLPKGIIYATWWYFLAGVCVLWIGAQSQSLSPWMMGLPLTIGQILVGVMLNFSMRSFRTDE